MKTRSRITRIGPNRYLIEHIPDYRGKAKSERLCEYCGRSIQNNTSGKLCSTCKRVAHRRRAVEEE